MVTLEWLMIVVASVALAASTALIVERTVEDSFQAPIDPFATVLQADIAAALVADEAQSVWEQATYTDAVDRMFEARCEMEILAEFRDVAARIDWTSPNGGPARCTVRPRAGLGG